MRGAKTIILGEMLLLWAGTIMHYQGRFASLPDAVIQVGVRTSIPTLILLFWLMLLADVGGEEGGLIAALLGGIIAFTYLTNALSLLNDLTDALLLASVPKES